MTATIDTTEDQVMALLRSFLLKILPGTMTTPPTTEVVQGQQNRVPEPSADDYVVMVPLMRPRLSTASNTYTDTTDPVGNPSGTNAATASTEFVVQLDFHGPNSGDYAQMATTLFRDEYACEFFAAGAITAAPLYTSDPRQMPFINGEAQFEDRWTIDASIQINPTVTVPQSFAGTLGPVGIISIEAKYPL